MRVIEELFIEEVISKPKIEIMYVNETKLNFLDGLRVVIAKN